MALIPQKISERTAAGAITGAELIPLVQGGADRTISVDNLLDWDNITNKETVATSANVKMTAEGGVAIRLLNKTGAASVKGTAVSASTATDNAFIAQANMFDTIGFVYEAGIADGSLCWVVVAGIAEVLWKNATTSTRGYVCIADDTNGRCINVEVPTGSPATTDHWKECGHVMETKTGGTNILVKCVIHFN